LSPSILPLAASHAPIAWNSSMRAQAKVVELRFFRRPAGGRDRRGHGHPGAHLEA